MDEQHPMAHYIALRINEVSAILKTTKLYIAWKNGEEAVVDFSDLISSNKHFKPLSNQKKFHAVEHASWGSCIEWECGIAMGSDQLRHMADEQDSVLHRQRLAG